MLIAIAGSIGAGKSTVARAVSGRLGVPLHSIDDDKHVEGAGHPDFAYWVDAGIPFPDAFRQRVFARALRQLRNLRAQHRHIIVEETFHRRSVREPFFKAAGEIMDGILLIEITVERSVAMRHLAQRAASDQGHMAGRAMFDAFDEIADPIDSADLVVANNGDLSETVDTVCAFLEDHL